MTELEALVGLNLILDIGSVRLRSLLEVFKKPQDIFDAKYAQLTSVFGIGAEIAQKIISIKKEDIAKEISCAQKLGLRIITINDKDYPENLKEIPGPPIVLYVKGGLKPEDKLSIAIVGSRRASFYGLHNAEKFALELASNGITIVSGMARGIDTFAHRGALKAGGRTIAVMGSGFENIYPAENKELAEEIAGSGAVISEFPLQTQPYKQNFPRRNRIISGLSLGVLVAEAARNSGALITADFALEQGKEVFALPGEIDSAGAFGTNGLIKEGAKLVLNVDDILEEFMVSYKVCTEKAVKEIINSNSGLKDEEAVVYNLIRGQAIQFDELAEKSKMGIAEISGILLKLQMRRLVRELPGKQFARASDEE